MRFANATTGLGLREVAELEAEKAREGEDITDAIFDKSNELPQVVKVEIDEEASPQAGRRFARN